MRNTLTTTNSLGTSIRPYLPTYYTLYLRNIRVYKQSGYFI